MSSNPLLETWDTPYGIPPFDQIKIEHYLPAFEAAFLQHKENLEAIATNSEAPTFSNTIEAMEMSNPLLSKVAGVLFNLTSSQTSDELQAIESKVNPRYAAHFAAVETNPRLFERINKLFENKSQLNLDQEELALLSEVHNKFVRAGAALESNKRDRVNAIEEQLASYYTSFGQHTLNDTNVFELVLETQDELAGLPESVLVAAAEEGRLRGKEGKYVFTISRSSFTPFMQFSENRELRQKLHAAYIHCGNNGTENDNNSLVKDITALRAERAILMGFESHAHYMLDDRMAKTPEAVKGLLDQVWKPAKEKVREEAEDLQLAIQNEGGNFELAPWDWWFYAEKVRAERFDFDAEMVKPYFQLENVRDGAFAVANKLYGLKFMPIGDFPRYHEDVLAYEVKDADGTDIGVFLVDYFMRPSKRGGAWMSTFRDQSTLSGNVRPIVVNVCNFPKGDGSTPCLLGLDEVTTLFHEFGHGLHGLLSNVKYASLSGTEVKQDFVELPSQIMEHWALEEEVLKEYAVHYKTGEVIPSLLIDKLKRSEKFNQGFSTTENLAACYLDLAWHLPELDQSDSLAVVENKTQKEIDLIDVVAPRYHSSYFQHIFTGESYSAGYYSYIWAEVLDTDGFEAFKENGIFDKKTANAFRKEVLEKGGTREPMTMYKAFRGREPEVTPLLKARGLE